MQIESNGCVAARLVLSSLLLMATTVTNGAAAVDETKSGTPSLGKVDFPTSADSQEAQRHFLRGVAALHSFWYPVALEEFRAATRVEPDFSMGYWGEAMAHNHPIWGDPQDTKAGRAVLDKVKVTAKATPRERAYIQAVRDLYGPGEKPARDQAYAKAMEKIYEQYPKDREAAAFYALALLGTVAAKSDSTFSTPVRTRMRAAAIAQDVFRQAPSHPGAAHYLLHAFDDPDHAILALPAARRYADIAPAAPHALHMPAHIFLQLGMWPETAASNEAAWKASDAWTKREGLPVSQRDYHSLHWLLYAFLQQGRSQEADGLLVTMRESLAAFPQDDPRNMAFGSYTLANMAAALVVETERWQGADALLAPLLAEPASGVKPDAQAGPYQMFAALARAPAVFSQGLAEAKRNLPTAATRIATLRRIREQVAGAELPFVAGAGQILEIQELEIAAVAAAVKGDFAAATKSLTAATRLEEALPPPSGPPPVIKPSHELYGEILLDAGRRAAAKEQFAKALFRHPGRARSLLGIARATDSGDGH